MVKVICLNKEVTTSRNGKKLYFLDLFDTDTFRVYKALTTQKHFECIEPETDVRDFLIKEFPKYEGYINFNNGFTNFYLPKYCKC